VSNLRLTVRLEDEGHTGNRAWTCRYGGKLVVLHITPDDRAALQSLANGDEPEAVARRLGLSERQVETQLSALFRRMGVRTSREAVNAAARRGLLKLA
jgi:DNA-binding NarL/FixJ family response regulator